MSTHSIVTTRAVEMQTKANKREVKENVIKRQTKERERKTSLN